MTNPQPPSAPNTPLRSLRRNKDAFYKIVWPELEQEGWTKIDASESMSGKPIFVPKVMELKVGQKGEDFYDDEEAVIARLLERRSNAESTIADAYLAKVGTPVRADVPKAKPKAKRLDRNAQGSIGEGESPPKDTALAKQDGSLAYPEPDSSNQLEHGSVDDHLSDMDADGAPSSPLQGTEDGGQMEKQSGSETAPEAYDLDAAENDVGATTEDNDATEEASKEEAMEDASYDNDATEEASKDELMDGPADDIEAAEETRNEALNGGDDIETTEEASKEEVMNDLSDDNETTEEASKEEVMGDLSDDNEATEEPSKEEVMDDLSDDNEATGEPSKEDLSDGLDHDKEAAGEASKEELSDGSDHDNEAAEAASKEDLSYGVHHDDEAAEEQASKEDLLSGFGATNEARGEMEGEEEMGDVSQDATTDEVVENGSDSPKNGGASMQEDVSEGLEESTGDKGDASTTKDADDADPAKKKRRGRKRPKRSTSKGKSETTDVAARKRKATRNDKAAGKGKVAYDASDRDGSDYQSSDESQPDRKRKTASGASSGRGRGRGGRPRGRPRRKAKGAVSPKRGATPPRGRKPKPAATALLDLTWKNGGTQYPKKVSQVGTEYNATCIEPAGTWKEDESKIYCDQIWDPNMAEEKLEGETKDLLAERGIPHNKREAAMVGLAAVAYDAKRFDDENMLANITTKDGSEWSDEERKRYHWEIFRARKDIREVSRVTGKDMNSCFAYYLGTFKKSDDYRLLKTVCYQERLRRLMDAEHDLDACAVCGDGGNLLICDGCEGEYHMECLRPALKSIPEGKWECDECVDRAFIAAKDSLIRNSSLFHRLPSGQKNEEEGEPSKESSGESNSGSLRVRPTTPVLDIISKLAQNISEAFTESALNGE